MSGRFLILCAVSLILAACSRPESEEQFVREDQIADSCYVFNVEMDDSLATYDLSFYTKFKLRKQPSSLRLDICWISPSGLTGEETVYMDPAVVPSLYRSSVVPTEFGQWTLKVKTPEEPRGMLGLGLINKRNGTR